MEEGGEAIKIIVFSRSWRAQVMVKEKRTREIENPCRPKVVQGLGRATYGSL